MSGYLQRLARTAMQPAETIHPMVGSVFSPVERGRTGDWLEQNVRSVVSSESAVPVAERSHEASEVRAPHSPLLPPVQPVAATSISLTGREPADNQATPGERASFQPLITAAPSQDSTEERKRDSPVESQPRNQQPERIYTPLVTETRARAGPPDLANLKSHAAPISARERWSPSHAEREADEIQIHIGRIEVTAVQQAPARTVLKPVHKGQSLDDYLKHRDRRA